MRLFSFLGQRNRTAPRRRNRHALSLTTLESRDVPAAWYTVHLDSAPQGTVGSTAASITSGNLHINSAYDSTNTGTGLVFAESASDAIRTALTGGVVVNLSAVSLPPASYTFTPGTSSGSTGNQTAFAVTPTVPPTATGPSTWKVYLEDLTANPTASDWDYNDFYWTVSVGQPPGQPNGSPTAVADTAAASRNTTIAFDVLANDSDPNEDTLNVTSAGVYGVTPNGTVTVSSDGGSLVYTPNANFTGVDTFTYTISDGHGGSATGTATVTVYAYPLVTVTGSSDPIYPDASAPTFDVPFTLHWVGESATTTADVQYRVTVLDGVDFTNTVSQQTFTATFAPGQTTLDSTFALATGSTERQVKIEALPPAPGVPPYATDPVESVFLCQVKVPVNRVVTYSSQADKDDTSKGLIVTYKAGNGNDLNALPVVATHYYYYPMKTWNVVGETKPLGIATHTRVSLTNQFELISGMGQVITSTPVGLTDTVRDDRGHLTASRFGGIDDPRNAIAQLKSENRPGGRMFAVEVDMAAYAKGLGAGQSVEYTIHPFYHEAAITIEVNRYNALKNANQPATLDKSLFRPYALSITARVGVNFVDFLKAPDPINGTKSDAFINN